jgi:hypothetical protein
MISRSQFRAILAIMTHSTNAPIPMPKAPAAVLSIRPSPGRQDRSRIQDPRVSKSSAARFHRAGLIRGKRETTVSNPCVPTLKRARLPTTPSALSRRTSSQAHSWNITRVVSSPISSIVSLVVELQPLDPDSLTPHTPIRGQGYGDRQSTRSINSTREAPTGTSLTVSAQGS